MKKQSIQLLFIALIFLGFAACTTQTPEEKRKEDLKESAGKLAESTQDFVDQVSSNAEGTVCLLYTSPSPRDGLLSRMPSSA